jgi:hypothetical protein
MTTFFQFSLNRKTEHVLCFAVIIGFAICSIVRLYPFTNTLPEVVAGIDDWSRYAKNALDIKSNGLSLSSIQSDYDSPAGFLYNYFVAACFSLFGENVIPVYIIQSLLLGVSIVLVYKTFSEKINPSLRIYFLFALVVFAAADISIHYTFRLLSENLALFTFSTFFYFLLKGIDKNSFVFLALSAFLLGISVLVRPNIIACAVIVQIILCFSLVRKKKFSWLLSFVGIFFLSFSLLALRNYCVSGNWTFVPTEGRSFINNLGEINFSVLMKKILFCFGIMTPLQSNCVVRPHWIIMWIAYLIYFFLKVKHKQKFELWEILTHSVIISYFGLLVLIAPQLGSYGFRLLIPALLIIIPFGFIAWGFIFSKTGTGNSRPT